jgi:hypothetical protein
MTLFVGVFLTTILTYFTHFLSILMILRSRIVLVRFNLPHNLSTTPDNNSPRTFCSSLDRPVRTKTRSTRLYYPNEPLFSPTPSTDSSPTITSPPLKKLRTLSPTTPHKLLPPELKTPSSSDSFVSPTFSPTLFSSTTSPNSTSHNVTPQHPHTSLSNPSTLRDQDDNKASSPSFTHNTQSVSPLHFSTSSPSSLRTHDYKHNNHVDPTIFTPTQCVCPDPSPRNHDERKSPPSPNSPLSLSFPTPEEFASHAPLLEDIPFHALPAFRANVRNTTNKYISARSNECDYDAYVAMYRFLCIPQNYLKRNLSRRRGGGNNKKKQFSNRVIKVLSQPHSDPSPSIHPFNPSNTTEQRARKAAFKVRGGYYFRGVSSAGGKFAVLDEECCENLSHLYPDLKHHIPPPPIDTLPIIPSSNNDVLKNIIYIDNGAGPDISGWNGKLQRYSAHDKSVLSFYSLVSADIANGFFRGPLLQLILAKKGTALTKHQSDKPRPVGNPMVILKLASKVATSSIKPEITEALGA